MPVLHDVVVHYTEYDTRLAAYAVVSRAGGGGDQGSGAVEVLLARGNAVKGHRWTLPGGGVELEETVEHGAVREVREETGYAVRLGALLGTHSHVAAADERVRVSDRPMKAFRVFFAAEVVGGELRDEATGTTEHAAWVPLVDVAGLDRVPLLDVGLGLAGLLTHDRSDDRSGG